MNYLSLSAALEERPLEESSLEASIVKAMTPVRIDQDKMQKYLDCIFPKPTKRGDFYAKNRRYAVNEYVAFAGNTQVRLEFYFNLLGQIFERASTLELDSTEAFFREAVPALVQSLNNSNTIRMGEKMGTETKKAIASLFNINPTTIQPSETAKGGFDIIVDGIPGHSLLSGLTPFRMNRELSSVVATLDQATAPDSISALNDQYDSELAKLAYKAARTAQAYLFGAPIDNKAMQNPGKRYFLPLSFDFESLNNILWTVSPLLRGVRIFENLDRGMYRDGMEAFYHITVRPYAAAPRISKAQYAALRNGTQVINPYYAAFSLRFMNGVAISLDKDIVRFITQGQEDTIPYLALSRWFKAWRSYYVRFKGDSGTAGRILRHRDLPISCNSASSMDALREARKAHGLAVYNDLGGENGLSVTSYGTLAALPAVDDVDMSIVREAEKVADGVLRKSLELGIPIQQLTSCEMTSPVLENESTSDKPLATAYAEFKQEGARFSGIPMGIDYNSGTMITAQQNDPTATRGMPLLGFKKPEALDIADFLGYDFANPGEAPNFRRASTVMGMLTSGRMTAVETLEPLMKEVAPLVTGGALEFYPDASSRSGGNDERDYSRKGAFAQIEGDFNYSLLQIAYLYNELTKLGHMRSISQIVADVAKERKLETIATDPYEKGLYSRFMSDTFAVTQQSNGALALAFMYWALSDATGSGTSNLMAQLYEQYGSPSSANAELVNDPRYFHCAKSPLYHIGHVFKYFGGEVFRRMCQEMADLNRKTLYSALSANEYMPSAVNLAEGILPVAILLSKYCPEDAAAAVMQQAEQEVERCKPDPAIEADDISAPGLKDGFMFMPHQMGAHKILRRRPRLAVIDVEPGGGKTLMLLLDIMCCARESDEPIKPIVVAPNRLVVNWCEDLSKATDQWNVVPLTVETYSRWGEDKLLDLINNAPRNTIYVAGMSFVSGKSIRTEVAGVRIVISSTCEFLERFGFNYVVTDESHKAKNLRSVTHQRIKKLYCMPTLRYLRIATGTMIMDRLRDIVAQVALLSPTVFGSDLTFSEFGGDNVSGAELATKVRSRLQNHVAVVSYKRKHWAFMLPNPVDQFIHVRIDDPEVEGSSYHQQVYTAAYDLMVDLVDNLTRKEKSKTKVAGEEGGEEGGDDDEAGTSDTGDDDPVDNEDTLGVDAEDDIVGGSLELQNHLAYMEMLLTDPMQLPTLKEQFTAAGYPNFVSAKIRAILDRVSAHFEVADSRDPSVRAHQMFKWTRGCTPRELDLAEYEGKTYMARKKSDDYKRQDLPPSLLPPPEDPAYWKLEATGKLIIFTRFTNNCNAIYNALPEKYKRVAVRFHGSVAEFGESADVNLDRFKNDPSCQILISNEQAISEGHNMQMASRIIRSDTPWSPGVYEQSTARIFRPDVSAANLDSSGQPGDLPREVVFIDWVMTVGTLEVAKVARLMWKSVSKTVFDEHDNPRYEPLRGFDLEPIAMSAGVLKTKHQPEDFREYFVAKRTMNDIQAMEFSQMRKSTVAKMVALPSSPMDLSGARMLDSVPIQAGQRINDRTPFGLIRFMDWVAKRNLVGVLRKDFREVLNALPVYTEFGNGLVVGVNFTDCKNVNDKGEPFLDLRTPVSSLKVRLAGTSEIVSLPYGCIFVATNVTPKDMDAFFKNRKTVLTDSDKKRVESTTRKSDVKIDAKVVSDSDVQRTVDASVASVSDAADKRKRKRKDNVAAGLPQETGVSDIKPEPKIGASIVDGRIGRLPTTVPKDEGKKPGKKPSTSPVSLDDLDGTDQTLTLIPSVLNNFVALYADSEDPDAAGLKAYGFIPFSDYAYVDVTYADEFNSVLDFLEENFKLDSSSEDRLNDIQDGFAANNGRMTFNSRLAVKKLGANLTNFFLEKKAASRSRQLVKVYPMVLEEGLRLMIDLKESPAILPFIGRKVAGKTRGNTGKLLRSVGMNVFFAGTVAAAKQKMNELIKAGYTIDNVADATTELDSLRLIAAKEKSKAKTGTTATKKTTGKK
jgi:hypothetical protein